MAASEGFDYLQDLLMSYGGDSCRDILVREVLSEDTDPFSLCEDTPNWTSPADSFSPSKPCLEFKKYKDEVGNCGQPESGVGYPSDNCCACGKTTYPHPKLVIDTVNKRVRPRDPALHAKYVFMLRAIDGDTCGNYGFLGSYTLNVGCTSDSVTSFTDNISTFTKTM